MIDKTVCQRESVAVHRVEVDRVETLQQISRYDAVVGCVVELADDRGIDLLGWREHCLALDQTERIVGSVQVSGRLRRHSRIDQVTNRIERREGVCIDQTLVTCRSGFGCCATCAETHSGVQTRGVALGIATTHHQSREGARVEQRALDRVARIGKDRLDHLRHTHKGVEVAQRRNLLHGHQLDIGARVGVSVTLHRQQTHHLIVVPAVGYGRGVERRRVVDTHLVDLSHRGGAGPLVRSRDDLDRVATTFGRALRTEKQHRTLDQRHPIELDTCLVVGVVERCGVENPIVVTDDLTILAADRYRESVSRARPQRLERTQVSRVKTDCRRSGCRVGQAESVINI